MATRREVFERPAHLVELALFAFQFGRSCKRQRFDIGARAAAVLPQSEERPYFFDREAEIPRTADESQRTNVSLVIIAIAGVPTRRGLNEADLLVVANHAFADSANEGSLADLHSLTVRSRSEFPITVTELNAIAAPAMIGLSNKPNHG